MIKHYAKVENNVVTAGMAVEEAEMQSGVYGDGWLEVTYAAVGGVGPDGSPAVRKNYPAIGWEYDPSRDAFLMPRPFPSWNLNEETCLWEPPSPMPEDAGTGTPPKGYNWNEETQQWDFVPPIIFE
jgi:hypothetical protein